MSRKGAVIIPVGVLGLICLLLCSRYGQLLTTFFTGVDIGATVIKATVVGVKENYYSNNSASFKADTMPADEDNLGIGEGNEPYANRWQRRFSSSEARNKAGGYLFLRHNRKAGGTSLRAYFRDVLAYHNITRNLDDWRAAKDGAKQPDHYQVHYIEHEFQAMDWQCPSVDPRWNESLSIIVLRHPIERHLSEFFFSGSGKKFYPIDRGKLYVNETYTGELSAFLEEWIPKWMKRKGTRNTVKAQQEKDITGMFNMIFGRFYTDNFQLRSLAGCSSGECLEDKVQEIADEDMDKVEKYHPYSHSYADPVPRCTQYFRKDDTPALFETCAKTGHIRDECAVLGCDGPCFYPTVAWGKMTKKDLARAIDALKAFDAVLLMEKLNNQDQADFLSDVLGVPRDAEWALAKREGDKGTNIGIKKEGNREKTHFYRDLLTKLGLFKSVSVLLLKENALEIELFEYAEKLNEAMIEQWKKETNIN